MQVKDFSGRQWFGLYTASGKNGVIITNQAIDIFVRAVALAPST